MIGVANKVFRNAYFVVYKNRVQSKSYQWFKGLCDI
jgi:hypothetical protein